MGAGHSPRVMTAGYAGGLRRPGKGQFPASQKGTRSHGIFACIACLAAPKRVISALAKPSVPAKNPVRGAPRALPAVHAFYRRFTGTAGNFTSKKNAKRQTDGRLPFLIAWNFICFPSYRRAMAAAQRVRKGSTRPSRLRASRYTRCFPGFLFCCRLFDFYLLYSRPYIAKQSNDEITRTTI